jgi:hypothetical protein
MYCPLVTKLNGYFPTCCYIKLVRVFFSSSIAIIGSIDPVGIGMVELRLHSLGKFPNKPFFLFLFSFFSNVIIHLFFLLFFPFFFNSILKLILRKYNHFIIKYDVLLHKNGT